MHPYPTSENREIQVNMEYTRVPPHFVILKNHLKSVSLKLGSERVRDLHLPTNIFQTDPCPFKSAHLGCLTELKTNDLEFIEDEI